MTGPRGPHQGTETEMLPAGRELDTLVAERVMGWTVNRADGRHWHTVGPTGRERGILIGRDCCADKYDRAFCPSTDIAAAWEVVAKMGSHPSPKFRNLALIAYCYNRTYATFNADDFPDGTGERWAEANGEHATPLAICRAALAAVVPS